MTLNHEILGEFGGTPSIRQPTIPVICCSAQVSFSFTNLPPDSFLFQTGEELGTEFLSAKVGKLEKKKLPVIPPVTPSSLRLLTGDPLAQARTVAAEMISGAKNTKGGVGLEHL